MISPSAFVDHLRQRGFLHFTGVPCSYLKPLSNCVLSRSDLLYLGAADEGQAVAIAAGLALAGRPAVTMFQNSGLGNAVNPLTSLTYPFGIPVLLLCSLRGDPEGSPDEPQHRLMGSITQRLLELMEIRWEFLPAEVEGLGPCLDRAGRHMAEGGTPYALIIRNGDFEKFALQTETPVARAHSPGPVAPVTPTFRRTDYLAAILGSTGPADALIATTGYTSRELWALQDRANHFYMVGSMGCAASLGLGVAVGQPDRRVVVVDGDGALLMRMGILATIGHQQPQRLVHIVLDNGQHESTGGQSTVSASLDLCAMARACGYPRVSRVDSPDQLRELLETPGGPHFIHVPTVAGVPPNLPRPTDPPERVAQRFRRFLQG